MPRTPAGSKEGFHSLGRSTIARVNSRQFPPIFVFVFGFSSPTALFRHIDHTAHVCSSRVTSKMNIAKAKPAALVSSARGGGGSAGAEVRVATVPVPLRMYFEAPTEEITLEDFELFALDRLAGMLLG